MGGGASAFDVGFYEDMGYMISDILNLFGPPTYYDDGPDDVPQGIQGKPPPCGLANDAAVQFSTPEVSQPVQVPQEVYTAQVGTPTNIVAESVESSNFS